MRFPTSSCLLYKPSIVAKTLSCPRLVVSYRAASSLSAIHNGLRQSEKSRPQGFKREALDAAKSRRSPQTSRRSRDTDSTPPSFKIKRGKKDVTDRGPERQSRRARFNDPTSNFGKKSLVYQMKHGDLRQKMAELEQSDRRSAGTPSSSRRGSSQPISSADFIKSFDGGGGRSQRPARDDRRGTSSRDSRRPVERDARTRSTDMQHRNGDRGRTTRFPDADADAGGRGADRDRKRTNPFADMESVSGQPPRLSATRRDPLDSMPKLPSDAFEKLENEARKEPRFWKDDDTPIRIHHTTAASQFLYGRSVVEAALKDSRRQLYKLYIYNGDDRRNLQQDEALERLARHKGVEITKVPNSGLRALDKMSGGRPHNGCVLEASPLPQLPLKALGPLSEDPAEPGFHLELAHQSVEDAKVNGTSDFVPYHLPKGRNPFVLLLDGILDPGNLGAILRSAAFLGVDGIAITKGSSATLTAVALKASAGASEVATLFSVSSTREFIARSKENGWLVYAAVPGTRRSRGNSHLTINHVESYDPLSSQPTLLVIGSEGEGLEKPVRRLADHQVSIPSPAGSLTNIVDSLNVSVATGILCAGFLKKQSSGMGIREEPQAEREDEDKEDPGSLW
ncbi:RNA methyltransferase [Poronia punctata]|nr:RNA methyltransferase [Poronia punctata]